MSFVLGYGPNGTAVDGVTDVTFPVAPLNYDADFRVLEEGPGKVVLTDITSPLNQPSTLRIAQSVRANVYANTEIDSSAYLSSKRGSDTIIEVREVWSKTESTDPSYERLFPVRCAITLTVPTDAIIDATSVKRLVARTVAGLATMGDNTYEDGIDALLHGVVARD